ncbi:hypothetical protein LOK49_LG05G00231 [Camellia lanceoleosa]|uniref:Uncharacterized protein n=1 Tax=Camellia lanceoleosa TaxID=1840588 RepID=A0ACC0HK97_9ERIC|nr:hypothetical protein LOK49_LG05G00231 [Camellia lanceoleosa]
MMTVGLMIVGVHRSVCRLKIIGVVQPSGIDIHVHFVTFRSMRPPSGEPSRTSPATTTRSELAAPPTPSSPTAASPPSSPSPTASPLTFSPLPSAAGRIAAPIPIDLSSWIFLSFIPNKVHVSGIEIHVHCSHSIDETSEWRTFANESRRNDLENLYK